MCTPNVNSIQVCIYQCKYTFRGSTAYAFIYYELLPNIVLLSKLNVFIFQGCFSAVYILQSFERTFLCKSAIFLSLCLVLCGQWLDHKRQGHRERLIQTRCLLPTVETVNTRVWFKGGVSCH